MTSPAHDLGLRRLSQLTAATDGSSALALHDWPAPARRSAAPKPPTPLSLVLMPTPVEGAEASAVVVDATKVALHSDPAAAALREHSRGLAQALVEIVAGDRTLTQLVRWTTAEVYEQLHHRVHTLATCPPPAADLAGRHRRRRPRVATVHLSQPAVGVAEVSARVDHGTRSTAVALRLERRIGARRVCDGGGVRRVAEERWVCTAVSWA